MLQITINSLFESEKNLQLPAMDIALSDGGKNGLLLEFMINKNMLDSISDFIGQLIVELPLPDTLNSIENHEVLESIVANLCKLPSGYLNDKEYTLIEECDWANTQKENTWRRACLNGILNSQCMLLRLAGYATHTSEKLSDTTLKFLSNMKGMQTINSKGDNEFLFSKLLVKSRIQSTLGKTAADDIINYPRGIGYFFGLPTATQTLLLTEKMLTKP